MFPTDQALQDAYSNERDTDYNLIGKHAGKQDITQ